MFRKACYISTKMATELNLSVIKISKILVNEFGPEYKHSLREGPFLEQEPSKQFLFLSYLSSRITGLRGR